MSSNPNNAVGTNAAYGGRTSVNAFNDITTAYSRGILSGWACVPNSGLTVSLGGDGTNRDVAIAEDNAGNKTSINNISGSPIDITLSAAPASNSRIDAIVAYVDNPPNGTSTIVDNPEACGIIAVTGTVSASPTPPTENQIRTAITADGASGTTAYYVVLANITVVNGTTDIIADDIIAGSSANLNSNSISDNSITSSKIDFTTFSVNDLNFGHYTKTTTSLGYGATVTIARIGNLVFLQGSSITSSGLPDSETSLSEKIPLGYRPITTSAINALCGSETNKFATWVVRSDGDMTLIATGLTGTGNKRINISSAWVTQDNWPS